EKERLVITMYYYEGLTLKEIGLVMNLSESRISQLHTKAIMRMRGKLSKYKMKASL
ncbi:MAG TPA: RNA polymerase sigma factor WhiG, partial [Clostridia bacterium]|nr:RNA polymerase sigma factor WhiG [Clostridia bacterium]